MMKPIRIMPTIFFSCLVVLFFLNLCRLISRVSQHTWLIIGAIVFLLAMIETVRSMDYYKTRCRLCDNPRELGNNYCQECLDSEGLDY